MKNYVQKGDALDFVAPSGGVVSGTAVLIGVTLVIPVTSAAEGETFAGAVEGVFELPAATSQAWATPGLKIYWDGTNDLLTTTASGNSLVGITAAPKGSAAAVGNVKLRVGG